MLGRDLPTTGTGSPAGLGFSWHLWIDLGLKNGRGNFCLFVLLCKKTHTGR
jgi:hypothetical protein